MEDDDNREGLREASQLGTDTVDRDCRDFVETKYSDTGLE